MHVQHLTALQKKYAGAVKIIGISTDEDASVSVTQIL